MTCPNSVASSHGEKYPDLKSSWEVDPDRPGHTMCSQLTDHRIVGLVVGSAPTAQPHQYFSKLTK